jgi:hypothetical protein
MKHYSSSPRSYTNGAGNRSPVCKHNNRRRWARTVIGSAVIHSWVCCCFASLALGGPGPKSPTRRDDSHAFLDIQIETEPKLSNLKPGSVLKGDLRQAVYSGYRELFPAGSHVRLIVGTIERRKQRGLPDDRSFLIRFFAPKHEPVISFRSVTVILPSGSQIPVHGSFVALHKTVEVHAKNAKLIPQDDGAGEANGNAARGLQEGSKLQITRRNKTNPSFVLVLRIEEPEASPGIPSLASNSSPSTLVTEAVTLAAGTRARLMIMQGVSASKSRPGDAFEARLVEPIRLGPKMVLPEGSIFRGLVAGRVPPRVLSRPGTLYLSFTKLTFPAGPSTAILASPVSAEVDGGSYMTMDSEGVLHGGGLGTRRRLLELGVSAGIAKVTDDSAQLIMELLISSATDASTAGAGRIIAACTSGLYFLTRHGRDVLLPKYTQMDISFNQPVALTGAVEGQSASPGTGAAPRKND